MTLAIAVVLPEGVVIAADSRMTSPTPNVGTRIISDYAVKVFELTSTIGAATFGSAFLNNQNINSHIVKLRQSLTTPPSTVKDMAQEVGKYFEQEYQKQLKVGSIQPIPAGSLLGFLVAGFDNKSSVISELWQVLIPGPVVQRITVSSTPGAGWNGQVDVIFRLTKGYDPTISQLSNFPANYSTQLAQLEYIIPFEAMTLQDAVDYVVFLIRATIDMQRFSHGIAKQPGSVPGVGGAIDIGVIEPNRDFRFLQKKELHGERPTV